MFSDMRGAASVQDRHVAGYPCLWILPGSVLSAMVKYDNTEIPRIMRGMLDDMDHPFIARQDVQGALRLLSDTRVGLRDERDPTCLLAVGMTLESGLSEVAHRPVDCGQDASAKTHSITEHGRLSRIAKATKGGDVVLRLMPDAHHLVDFAKEDGGYPGSRGLWEIDRVQPHCVPIALASVGHSVCADHDRDKDFLGLVDDLDLSSISDYRRITGIAGALSIQLLRLGHRTLLYRVGQLRGLELEVTFKRVEQVRAGNRYAVDILDANLKRISDIVRSLYRDKLVYDQCFVGNKRSDFVHHVMPFRPRVRFAASEYVDIPCTCHMGTPAPIDFLASVNVLPGDDLSWLVVTYPAARCKRELYDSTVSNWVRDFCAVNDVGMKRHLQAMGSWINLYCSPDDYHQLDERDRSFVEKSVASSMCRDPFRQHIDVLLTSPRGGDLVKKWLNR